MRTIDIYYPGKTRSVSVTGAICSLNCSHCSGHYLRDMISLKEAEETDSSSFLISGGCDREGKVPITRFMDEIRSLKNRARLNIHCGLVDEEEAKAISEVADKVSFDFTVDDDAIRDVFGLNKSGADYIRSYGYLKKYTEVVPHILIGLKGGIIDKEYEAVRVLKEMSTEKMAFIIFKPTFGTPFSDRRPPGAEDAAKVLEFARGLVPDGYITLGCMRPGGSYRDRIDRMAVEIGVDGIVNPTPSAVRYAEELGYGINIKEECCVL
ncbi:MAG: hypothetical protein QME46_02890 [Thermoanaerobacteraceae bacterium]|nr:hypothetical protein [Thermoanaerobacteraceae bacterium]